MTRGTSSGSQRSGREGIRYRHGCVWVNPLYKARAPFASALPSVAESLRECTDLAKHLKRATEQTIQGATCNKEQEKNKHEQRKSAPARRAPKGEYMPKPSIRGQFAELLKNSVTDYVQPLVEPLSNVER